MTSYFLTSLPCLKKLLVFCPHDYTLSPQLASRQNFINNPAGHVVIFWAIFVFFLRWRLENCHFLKSCFWTQLNLLSYIEVEIKTQYCRLEYGCLSKRIWKLLQRERFLNMVLEYQTILNNMCYTEVFHWVMTVLL